MKVKTISRNDRDYQRQNKLEVHKVQRNYAPELHQFERAREYTRALAATKLDKVFAKPFVAALDAHEDGITSMTTVPGSLGYAVTGAADGEVICWHLKNRELLWRTRAHSSLVRGVTVDRNGKVAVTVGQDGSIHAWALDREVDHLGVTEHGVGRGREVDALHSYETQSQLTEVDYTWDTGSHVFATSGEQVSLWDLNRSTPVHSFTWGIDTVRNVRFNRVQHSVLASVGADRSIVLYDTRQRSALRKVTLRMQSNDLCWNPREAFNFSVACEDHRAYTFDMRKLNRALNVHKDHVNAVLSIDYSPTGREFVTGSYDRTVRIFDARNGHSRVLFSSFHALFLSCCLTQCLWVCGCVGVCVCVFLCVCVFHSFRTCSTRNECSASSPCAFRRCKLFVSPTKTPKTQNTTQKAKSPHIAKKSCSGLQVRPQWQ
ncbi:MAG: hypothetical protein MHM6MM_008022 [Cercozoa sp. M6MM]